MGSEARRLRVLFLCTGNACRSQMAEGWARALKGELLEVHSAGTNPHGLNRLAAQAMAEVGIDLSGHSSKHVASLQGLDFDYVVTVCDAAREACPLFPGRAKVVHRGFEDPPHLARDARSDVEALPHYRKVRDQIRAFVETLPEALAQLERVAHGSSSGTPREA